MSESAFSQSVSVTHVCVVMFVLSRIKGVELHRNWHLEVMRHMIWQREQPQLLFTPRKAQKTQTTRRCAYLLLHDILA